MINMLENKTADRVVSMYFKGALSSEAGLAQGLKHKASLKDCTLFTNPSLSGPVLLVFVLKTESAQLPEEIW